MNPFSPRRQSDLGAVGRGPKQRCRAFGFVFGRQEDHAIHVFQKERQLLVVEAHHDDYGAVTGEHIVQGRQNIFGRQISLGKVEGGDFAWTGGLGGRDDGVRQRPAVQPRHQRHGFAAPTLPLRIVLFGEPLGQDPVEIYQNRRMPGQQRGKGVAAQLQHFGRHVGHDRGGAGFAGNQRQLADDLAAPRCGPPSARLRAGPR